MEGVFVYMCLLEQLDRARAEPRQCINNIHLSIHPIDKNEQGLAAEAAAVTEALALPPACIIAAATSSAAMILVGFMRQAPGSRWPWGRG